LTDAFLDGPVVDERRALWRKRFSEVADFTVFLAERDGAAHGFICFMPDQHATWGGLIDNFHVSPAAKGQGIGRLLFSAVRGLSQRAWPGRGLFLFVLAGNTAARLAYDRLGGQVVEALTKPEPDGQEHDVLRYAWSAEAVIDG
jgi:ribosomal protein S18 acetylase RimI-like enzyme